MADPNTRRPGNEAPTPTANSGKETRDRTRRILLFGTLAFIVVFLVVSAFGQPSNAGLRDSAAALGIITALAVGIERLVEVFWTVMAQLRNSWWPLNEFANQVDQRIHELNSDLNPFYARAQAHLQSAFAAGTLTQEQLDVALRKIREVEARRDQILQLTADNQRVHMIAANAFDAVFYLEKAVPGLQADAALATQAITGLTDFVGTFKDNPARKLMSIYAGMLLGMVVCGFMGLDLIQATLQPAAQGTTQNLGSAQAQTRTLLQSLLTVLPALTVALTGVIVGLGSNPTHEIIRSLQEFKQARKAENEPALETSDTPGTLGVPNLPQPSGPATLSDTAPQGGMQMVAPQTLSLRSYRTPKR